MNKKSKIKKILAFGSLILLLLLFIIFTTKNCRSTKAEEITPNYSTISLYDNNNNLIASKPLEPLINVYNGTYEDLGKTLLIENELINSNQTYTFIIEFNNIGSVRYYTNNFKWICNYKTIAVDYEIQLTFLNASDNETTITYTPYEYFDKKSFLIIPNRIFSGTAELAVPVVSLSYSLVPSSNIFYSFIDNTYNGYGEGYARGYNEGYDDGIQYNNNETYMQGYNFGKQDGYNLGKMDGYNEGYADGYDDGRDITIQETEGLTINFNQLIQNGNFIDNSYWHANNSTLTFTDDGVIIIKSVDVQTYGINQTIPLFDNSNKYLFLFDVMSDNDTSVRLRYPYTSAFYSVYNYWQTKAYFTDNNTNFSNNGSVFIQFADNLNTNNIYLKNVMIFNLTQIYGNGNEPTTLEQFRELFPSEYYPYNESKIINVNYDIGYHDGYDDGVYDGIIQGETHQIEQTNFMVELFNALDSFLNIRLLPNITIGLLVFIPLMISLTWFIIKAFRGGSSE